MGSESIYLGYSAVLVALISSLSTQAAKQSNSCDLYQGSWKYDESYPFYDKSRCPFVDKEFDCQGNGRPDKSYLKYRWKPSACDLPRFDGVDFLKRMKGKKIMFIGDSLSFDQWNSLICMLHTALPKGKSSLENLVFKILDYGVTVTLSPSVYLVDIVKRSKTRFLELDSINGSDWKDADMLIFNTWHWWLRNDENKPWDYIQEGKKIFKDMDRLTAFGKALTTWSNWVDSNIDPKRTKVFFQGISPSHYNNDKYGYCGRQTKPVRGSTSPEGLPQAVAVVKNVLDKMSKHVELLDVTALSQLRGDGHPSSYGIEGKKGMDCLHWCLAGVPDTWNELLYASLVLEKV